MSDTILIVIIFGCIAYVFVSLGISAHNADQRARRFIDGLDGRTSQQIEDDAVEQRRQIGRAYIDSLTAPRNRRPPRYPRRHGPPTYTRRRRTHA